MTLLFFKTHLYRKESMEPCLNNAAVASLHIFLYKENLSGVCWGRRPSTWFTRGIWCRPFSVFLLSHACIVFWPHASCLEKKKKKEVLFHWSVLDLRNICARWKWIPLTTFSVFRRIMYCKNLSSFFTFMHQYSTTKNSLSTLFHVPKRYCHWRFFIHPKIHYVEPF